MLDSIVHYVLLNAYIQTWCLVFFVSAIHLEATAAVGDVNDCALCQTIPPHGWPLCGESPQPWQILLIRARHVYTSISTGIVQVLRYRVTCIYTYGN